MPHFAEIGEDNIVIRVLVVSDEDAHRGQEFLADDLGFGGTWIQTYKSNLASREMIYDSALGGFYWPQPYPSWTLNESTFLWEPPSPEPLDGKHYEWDEDAGEWVEIVPEVTPGGDADNPYPGDGNNPPFYQWNTETNEWDLVPE